MTDPWIHPEAAHWQLYTNVRSEANKTSTQITASAKALHVLASFLTQITHQIIEFLTFLTSKQDIPVTFETRVTS